VRAGGKVYFNNCSLAIFSLGQVTEVFCISHALQRDLDLTIDPADLFNNLLRYTIQATITFKI
jgi:hypothetical protein